MEIINSLHFPKIDKKENVALTIGTFDGVHQGHQAILKTLTCRGIPYVVTFNNHPQLELCNHAPLSITSSLHKLTLLKECGVHRCYELPFNKEFAQQSAKEFLHLLKKSTNFSYLILGHDAKIGHNREGNREMLLSLSKELDFHLEYIPPYSIHHQIISSTLIRNKIQNDQLEELAILLGRSYSILSVVIQGEQKGRLMGYPTANLDVSNLALPSLGVWICELIHKQKSYTGVANLGYAPTLHTDRRCLLEVHLLKEPPPLYGEIVEVIFKKHLRKEQCFSTTEELKKQIALDIKQAQMEKTYGKY